MSHVNNDVPVAKFNHPCILITINNKYGEEYDLYHQVRHAWKIDPKKAETYSYVMAVQGGIIQEVYKVIEWKVATHENFPEFAEEKPEEAPDRYGFTGVPARLIRLNYIGKKAPNECRSYGNPIYYKEVD